MTDDEATKLVTLFFGIERNGVREKGLVDHEDEESFDTGYNSIKESLPSKLVAWLETMKLCMLKPIRMAAGLGDPPYKWTNNVSECLHNVLKEEVGNETLDVASFLERAKSRVFDAQEQEMVRGIRGIKINRF